MGRPSEFSQEKADIICQRLSLGESLRRITNDKGMPDRDTVVRWLLSVENTGFHGQYARAREAQADAIFDECLDIADDGRNDWMEKNGGLVPDNEAVQRSRLRIDTRKWMAGKLRPKKYGEKIDVTTVDATPPEQSLAMIARKVALAFRIMAMDNETKQIEGKVEGEGR